MKLRLHPIAVAAVALSAAVLAGCAAGPDYRKPDVDMPVTWQLDAPWRQSTPSDTQAKGAWWERFGDAKLNALQEQALDGNQTLAVAAARLTQARATANSVSAGMYPQVSTGVRASRLRIAGNRPLTNYNAPNFATVQNDFALGLNASYEVDLFGRVQRNVEGAQASVEQSAADLENMRLLLSADLATNYFNLREIDTELDVLERAIGLQRRAIELVSARHDLGAATGLDLAQQQALLDTTLVQVDVLRRQRGQFEHAVATLAAIPVPQFTLAPDARELTVPPVPLGVPSDVLERRPDIASAERAMASANAQI